MKLTRLRRRSGGVIDRRGESPSGFGMGTSGFGGGGFGLPVGGGIGALLLVIILAFVLPNVLGGGSSGSGGALSPFGSESPVQPGSAGGTVDPNDPMGQFVDAVTDDVQTTWIDIFKRAGKTYEPTQVVLFSGSTSSACGQANEATGPFYCPADHLVYLDAGFFKELENRFGAPGDFAEAYVIAHEIGHHVQSLLGIEQHVQQLTQQDPSRANDLSIRLELQADCFAGVWGRAAQGAGILESGDLQEGLTAAKAVGDDRIQQETTGRINPETWTHGSSEQRLQWFKTGFQVGNPDACDTFAGEI